MSATSLLLTSDNDASFLPGSASSLMSVDCDGGIALVIGGSISSPLNTVCSLSVSVKTDVGVVDVAVV